MAGLINDALSNGGSGRPAGPQARQPSGDVLQQVYAIGDRLDAPPEAKQVFSKAVLAAVAILYDPHSGPAILQMLKAGAGADLPGTLARVALTVLSSVRAKAKLQPGPEVGVPLFSAVMLLVAELCVKSGVAAVDLPTLSKALQAGLQPLGQALQIPPQQVQQMQQNLGQLGSQTGVAGAGGPPPAPGPMPNPAPNRA